MKDKNQSDLRAYYQSLPTDELVRAATVARADYREDALAVIDAELEARNVSASEAAQADATARVDPGKRGVEYSGGWPTFSDAITSESSRDGIEPIGGWLVIPLLNLVFWPFVNGYRVINGYRGFFSSGSWGLLTSQQSQYYNPFHA